jgi:hypothetical protein
MNRSFVTFPLILGFPQNFELFNFVLGESMLYLFHGHEFLGSNLLFLFCLGRRVDVGIHLRSSLYQIVQASVRVSVVVLHDVHVFGDVGGRRPGFST